MSRRQRRRRRVCGLVLNSYKKSALVLLLTCALLLAGCEQTVPETGFAVYYLNADENELQRESFVPEAADIDTEGLILELTARLGMETDGENRRALLPEGAGILGHQLSGTVLTLNMERGYQEMEASREVLCRAGLVRTFLQIDGVDSVAFLVENTPLKNASGAEIGVMTANSFVENAARTINAYKNVQVTLYFTDETGTMLLPETRRMYYISSEPIEQAVVEELVKGPKESGHYPVLSSDTNILSAIAQEGVCHVNFDTGVQTSNLTVDAQIPIYAIVNSLTDTCHVEKVQFSVDGKIDVLFRGTVDLNEQFVKNTALVY